MDAPTLAKPSLSWRLDEPAPSETTPPGQERSSDRLAPPRGRHLDTYTPTARASGEVIYSPMSATLNGVFAYPALKTHSDSIVISAGLLE